MERKRGTVTTKDKIFLAAAELFAERSYAAVAVREIADKVGIKASSIYNHYASKEDILSEIINHYVTRLRQFLTEQDRRMREPGYRMTIRDIQFIYSKDEAELMFWITRIVYTEQFVNQIAEDTLLGVHNKRYGEGHTRLLWQLYERGLIRSKENIPIYTNMMVRMAQSYQTDFVHPRHRSAIDDLNDMYVYLLDMILSHEGTYDRRDEVIRDHVYGDPPKLKK